MMRLRNNCGNEKVAALNPDTLEKDHRHRGFKHRKSYGAEKQHDKKADNTNCKGLNYLITIMLRKSLVTVGHREKISVVRLPRNTLILKNKW
jgi:hypothetical protein